MAVVPLNNINPWTQAIAIAGQTVYSTNWTADALTDVVVYSRASGVAADDQGQILLTSQYNVAFIGSTQTVQVTLITPSNAGDIVTIIRNTPAQKMNLYSNTNFNPTMLNGDFSRETMMIQQRVLCDNNLAVKYNNSETLDPNGIIDQILPYLPPGNVWTKNLSNTAIIAAPTGSGPTGGQSLTIPISQIAHGFVANQIVYFNGTQFALAMADSPADAEVIGIVSSVINANNFYLTVSGQVISASAIFTPGSVYFLSDATPGLLTTTEPTTAGHISKPLLIATSPNTGYFFNFRGKVVNQNSPWNALTTNFQLSPNQDYFTLSGGTLVLTLPVGAPVGSIITIQGYGSTGWTIAQNNGQSILVEGITTTVGTGGSLSSTVATDGITLLCVVANTTFVSVGAPGGNITYV